MKVLGLVLLPQESSSSLGRGCFTWPAPGPAAWAFSTTNSVAHRGTALKSMSSSFLATECTEFVSLNYAWYMFDFLPNAFKNSIYTNGNIQNKNCNGSLLHDCVSMCCGPFVEAGLSTCSCLFRDKYSAVALKGASQP